MRNLFILKSPAELAEKLAGTIALIIRNTLKMGSTATVAISGGNTPKLLFEVLAVKYATSIKWDQVQIFWVDERCVTPEDPESNFGMTRRILLDKIGIPSSNIHRMRGEDEPAVEAARYSDEIRRNVRFKNGLPCFDIVLLGIGDDGHTASIFPGNLNLFSTEEICEVAVRTYSGQKRITLTGKVINNAEVINFLVTGKSKTRIVGDIFENNAHSLNYPASFIVPSHGIVNWWLDEEAGNFASWRSEAV
jgi:6-phosphogluconolactonase